jgi:hypothetical protein
MAHGVLGRNRIVVKADTSLRRSQLDGIGEQELDKRAAHTQAVGKLAAGKLAVDTQVAGRQELGKPALDKQGPVGGKLALVADTLALGNSYVGFGHYSYLVVGCRLVGGCDRNHSL